MKLTRSIIILCACAASAASFAATPAATQAWVADYVGKHASTGAVSTAYSCPISSSITRNGTNYTFSFTMNFAHEPTWKIVESTVTGMVAGTHFAFDAYGNACNYTNAACGIIYQSLSTNWTFVTKAWTTNGVPTFSTNRRDVVQLDFSVNGVDFRGYEDYRHRTVMAAGVSNSTGIIRFRRSYVTPAIRVKLITPPAQVSWLGLVRELFFPTARAGWDLGKWDDGTKNDDGSITYRAHYEWDGEALIVEVPSVTVNNSEGGDRFAVDYEEELNVNSGDWCKRTEIDVTSLCDEVKNAILGKVQGEMSEVEYGLFADMIGMGDFDSQIKAAIENAIKPYNVEYECPYTVTVPADEEPETPEDPPQKPTQVSCGHPTAYVASSSGACCFRCAVCQTVVKSYAEHDFENSDTKHHCAVCSNTYTDNSGKELLCGISSEYRGHHTFGEEYGGTAEGCRCKYRTVWRPHPMGSRSYVTGEWEYDGTNHWKIQKCGVCGYDKLRADNGAHNFYRSLPICVSESSCVISNICHTCGYSEFVETCGHVPTYHFHHKVDDDEHSDSAFCMKCLYEIVYDNQPHVDSGDAPAYKDAGDEGHGVYLTCVSGTNGCGSSYLARTEGHNIGQNALGYQTHETSNTCHYVLYNCTNCNHLCKTGPNACVAASGAAVQTSAKASESDYYPCVLCVNGLVPTTPPHNWRWNTDEHWCKWETVAEHLRDRHNMVSNVCTVCGYRASGGGGDTNEYMRVVSKVDCKDDCCAGGVTTYARPWIVNGVEIAEADRGEWQYWAWTADCSREGYSLCRYQYYEKCVCPYCRGDETGLLFNECYCQHLGKDLLKFTDAIITGDYHLRYAGSTVKLVDFSDPVYGIGDGCFLEAFVSMPNLIFVNASTVTNVGYRAFAYAFTNDTKLAEVWFNGLRTADGDAFLGAFRGCPLSTDVKFDQLANCGGGCFDGAFAGTSVAALGFPRLADPDGSLDFFGGTPCATVTSLSVPRLTEAADSDIFTFSDMPNLKTIDLSHASTNAVRHIGDLSNLSKLTRLDYGKMTDIPDFYGPNGERHAPTNATDCMIVVPSDLYPAWVNAYGWRDLSLYIVPYSNQVFRPYTVVSFESNGGDEVASVRCAREAGITPPATLTKWGSQYGAPYSNEGNPFTFDGWYADAALTEQYLEGTPFATTNATLYAKWTDNRQIAISGSSVTVKFEPAILMEDCEVATSSCVTGYSGGAGLFEFVIVGTSDGAVSTNRLASTDGTTYSGSYTIIPESATGYIEFTPDAMLHDRTIRSNTVTVNFEQY